MDDDNNSLCNNQHHQTEEEEEEDQQLQNHDGDDEDDGEDDEDVDVDEQPLAQSSNNSMNQNNTLKYSRMNGTNGSSSGGGTPFGGMGGNLTIDKPCISRNEKLSRRKHHHRDIDFFLDSASRSSCEREQHEKLEPQFQRQHSKQQQQQQQQQVPNNNQIQSQTQQQPSVGQPKQRLRTKSFRYSPDTTDCDSNCGDLDSKYLSIDKDNTLIFSCTTIPQWEKEEQSFSFIHFFSICGVVGSHRTGCDGM